MTIVNHPCIVRCYGMLEPSPGIVLELVEGNSLFQIIHGERGESFMQVFRRLGAGFKISPRWRIAFLPPTALEACFFGCSPFSRAADADARAKFCCGCIDCPLVCTAHLAWRSGRACTPLTFSSRTRGMGWWEWGVFCDTQYQRRLPWTVRMRYLLDSSYGLRYSD